MDVATRPHLPALNFTRPTTGGPEPTTSPVDVLRKEAPSFRALTRRRCLSLAKDSAYPVNPVEKELEAGGIERRRRRETETKTLEELKRLADEEAAAAVGRGLREYIDQVNDLIRSDGGPPRWFSPLESATQMKDSPVLLYLPGLDGVGLGLVLQQKKLGKMFDIWCLHIPIMDRTPFEDLVQLIERTIRSENNRLRGRPIYVVGESVGACIAISVAARNPNIDIVLILANPGTSYYKSNLQNLSTLLDNIPYQLSSTAPKMLSLISGHQVLEKIFSRESLSWKLQMVKSACAYSNSRLHACQAQILILVSGKDQFLPSKAEAQTIRKALPKCEIKVYSGYGKLPKCEIRTFKDAGYFIFLEDGIDLASIIRGASFYRRAEVHDYISDFVAPTRTEFNKISRGYRWIDAVTGPVMLSTLDDGKIVRGLEGIPLEGPVLFVGYHMLLGIEIYPLVCNFFSKKNILLRGLAHPMIFMKLKEDAGLDLSAFDAFRIMGAVPVSPKNLYKLLASKSHILLYPGGVREALHRKGEEYQLFWPERSEFVRMAAKFGAKIIPFGVVGEDDVCKLIFDYNDHMKIPYLRDIIRNSKTDNVRLRNDVEGEVANQDAYLPGVLPKVPGRFYFLFGKSIDTAGREEELRDKDKAHEVYLQVKSEVEKCIAYLKDKRENDPYRSIFSRYLYQATQSSASDVPTFEL